jgi:hypothetical protein
MLLAERKPMLTSSPGHVPTQVLYTRFGGPAWGGHHTMDPLSLLREYTITGKDFDFQIDGDAVTFGDERYDLQTPTAYRA